jgi:hypothetical protein
MRELFPLAIKSTLDTLGVGMAQSLTPPALFVDLDDVTATEEVFSSTTPAILWELGRLDESPRDPLYALTFSVGVRTSNDAANYTIMNLVGKLKEVFPIGRRILVADLSDSGTPAPIGQMIITKVDLNPQVYDRTSGIRMVSVIGRAQRYG